MTQKGDPRIVAELETALFRNRSGDNPNMNRGRMFFDFDTGRVSIPKNSSSREVAN